MISSTCGSPLMYITSNHIHIKFHFSFRSHLVSHVSAGAYTASDKALRVSLGLAMPVVSWAHETRLCETKVISLQ